jgi:hypothetical protein
MDASMLHLSVVPQTPIRGPDRSGVSLWRSSQSSSGIISYQVIAIVAGMPTSGFQSLAQVWFLELEHPVDDSDHLSSQSNDSNILPSSFRYPVIEQTQFALFLVVYKV